MAPTLPAELLLHILELGQFSPPVLTSFALASHAFYQAALPSLYTSISITVTQRHPSDPPPSLLEKEHLYLSMHLRLDTRSSRLVRSLVNNPSLPPYARSLKLSSSCDSQTRWSPDGVLVDALKFLPNIDALSIRHAHRDDFEALEGVIPVFLPGLRKLELGPIMDLRFESSEVYLDLLRALPGLKELVAPDFGLYAWNRLNPPTFALTHLTLEFETTLEDFTFLTSSSIHTLQSLTSSGQLWNPLDLHRFTALEYFRSSFFVYGDRKRFEDIVEGVEKELDGCRGLKEFRFSISASPGPGHAMWFDSDATSLLDHIPDTVQSLDLQVTLDPAVLVRKLSDGEWAEELKWLRLRYKGEERMREMKGEIEQACKARGVVYVDRGLFL